MERSPGNRKPSKFRKTDVVRAIKAAYAAGATLTRIEIDPNGRIVMIVSGENANELFGFPPVARGGGGAG